MLFGNGEDLGVDRVEHRHQCTGCPTRRPPPAPAEIVRLAGCRDEFARTDDSAPPRVSSSRTSTAGAALRSPSPVVYVQAGSCPRNSQCPFSPLIKSVAVSSSTPPRRSCARAPTLASSAARRAARMPSVTFSTSAGLASSSAGAATSSSSTRPRASCTTTSTSRHRWSATVEDREHVRKELEDVLRYATEVHRAQRAARARARVLRRRSSMAGGRASRRRRTSTRSGSHVTRRCAWCTMPTFLRSSRRSATTSTSSC